MGCSCSKPETTPKLKIDDNGSTTSITSISTKDMEDACKNVEDDDDFTLGDLQMFRKKSKQFLKGSVKNIVKMDIFTIKKESKLQNIAKTLEIVGRLCDVLENKTKQYRVAGYQKQVLDWICEIKLDDLCCRTICKFSTSRVENSDVFEDCSDVLNIVNSCLTILWTYCEISESFAIKIAEKAGVLEFAKQMLQENHKTMDADTNENSDREETESEDNEETLSYQDSDDDENADGEYDEQNVEDKQVEVGEDVEEDEQADDAEGIQSEQNDDTDEEGKEDELADDAEGIQSEQNDDTDEEGEEDELADDAEGIQSEQNDDTDEEGESDDEVSYFDRMITNCKLLLYHISLYEDNVPRLRELRLLPVLSPYMSSEQSDLLALVTVANIVNEKECKIINKACVESLLDILKGCLNSNNGKYRGWSAYQCGLAVRRLARTDQNHKLLLECDALPLIIKLSSDGKPAEQLEGVTALRYLAFNEKAKQAIVNDQTLGAIDTLKELCKLDDDKIREESYGALWTLRGDLEKSPVKEYRNIAKRLEKTKSTKAVSGGTHNMISYQWDFMISYQWDDKELAEDVKNRLTKEGYKVWIDSEKMKGSLLDAMANAIEKSRVVLVFICQKYKDSRNCRAEAEYAHQTEKAIIPVKTKRGYKADGWLGLMLGTKVYYEVSEKYPLKVTIKKLLNAVKSEYNK